MKLIKLENTGVTVNPEHIIAIEEIKLSDISDKTSCNNEIAYIYSQDELTELGLYSWANRRVGDYEVNLGAFRRRCSFADGSKVIFWKLYLSSISVKFFKTYVIGMKDYEKIMKNVEIV